MVEPYYSEGGITIYHGDCREILPTLWPLAGNLVFDPPYGVSLQSGMNGRHGDCRIEGDADTSLRDWVLREMPRHSALVFGSPKVAPPPQTRHKLIWDKGEHVGMGDLSLPWKPNFEEVYVIGGDYTGKRTSSVLRSLAVAGCVGTRKSRLHPTEKPVDLLQQLIRKCRHGMIIDPFCGSGSTVVAAKNLGRRAIGIEVSREYCDITVDRLRQSVLPLTAEPLDLTQPALQQVGSGEQREPLLTA